MKVAILANYQMSYVKPMAEGLSRMLQAIGVESAVFYDGWYYLDLSPSIASKLRNLAKNFIKHILNAAFKKEYIIPRSPNLIEEGIRASDLIVVVSHLPGAFLSGRHVGIEKLRKKLDVPIVLYDLVNLTTRGTWISKILGGYEGGGFGLERYDWYLSASVVSEFPMPQSFNAFSLVGLDLRDGTLYPEKENEFFAVLDFPRPGFESERDIQIQALEETNTSYIVLDRPMSINEIRRIYRKTCLFFLSFRESFGLPIVELQLCGSYICTPFKSWVPSHYIKENIYEPGEGSLSKNFLVYGDDKELLKDEITRIKSSYDPEQVVQEFIRAHPHLYHGDLAELKTFIEKVERGTISSGSHNQYMQFNDQIATHI